MVIFVFSGKDQAGPSRRWIRNTNKDEFESGKCLIYTAEEPTLDDKDLNIVVSGSERGVKNNLLCFDAKV